MVKQAGLESFQPVKSLPLKSCVNPGSVCGRLHHHGEHQRSEANQGSHSAASLARSQERLHGRRERVGLLEEGQMAAVGEDLELRRAGHPLRGKSATASGGAY